MVYSISCEKVSVSHLTICLQSCVKHSYLIIHNSFTQIEYCLTVQYFPQDNCIPNNAEPQIIGMQKIRNKSHTLYYKGHLVLDTWHFCTIACFHSLFRTHPIIQSLHVSIYSWRRIKLKARFNRVNYYKPNPPFWPSFSINGYPLVGLQGT